MITWSCILSVQEKTPDDPNGFNIKPLAEKYNLWQSVVFEYPRRIPYMDVLVHLDAADGVFILGSTEAHYTPSKVYQGVLSGKPILAVLHKESSALQVLNKTNAGVFYPLDPEHLDDLGASFAQLYKEYVSFSESFSPAQVKQQELEAYSAFSVTKKLAELIDKAMAL